MPSPDLRPGMHSTSSSTDFARTAVMIFSAPYTTFGSISYPLFSSHPHNLPFKTHNLSATSINRLYRECSGRKPPWRVDAVLGLSTCDRVLEWVFGSDPPCSQSAEHFCMSCQDTALSREVRLQSPVTPHMSAAEHDAVRPRKHVKIASEHDVIDFRLRQ